MGWSAADVVDQTGKVAVITGGNSGIGYQAALMLCAAGAHVVIACRNERKGRMAASGVCNTMRDPSISTVTLDLADLASVRTCADKLHQAHDRIDMLINNAGVMAIPQRATADGFEMQLGTNHLGHFALTGLVLDLLQAAPAGRVVNVSSTAHKFGTMDFDDLHSERKAYGAWQAYGQSKLANLLFTYELQRRLHAANSRAIGVACHPGYSATNLQSVGPQMTGSRVSGWFMSLGNRLVAQSAHDGALPTVYAATHPDIVGGDYVGPDGMREMWGPPRKTQSNAASHDADSQQQLWQSSASATGVTYLSA